MIDAIGIVKNAEDTQENNARLHGSLLFRRENVTAEEKLKQVKAYCIKTIEDCDCCGGSNRSETEKAEYEMAKYILFEIIDK